MFTKQVSAPYRSVDEMHVWQTYFDETIQTPPHNSIQNHCSQWLCKKRSCSHILSKDGVLEIQVRLLGICYEELRGIGVGTVVGHGYDSPNVVLERDVCTCGEVSRKQQAVTLSQHRCKWTTLVLRMSALCSPG